MTSGRYLHDLQVKDGIAYLAYWRDGLVILDVGNGVAATRSFPRSSIWEIATAFRCVRFAT